MRLGKRRAWEQMRKAPRVLMRSREIGMAVGDKAKKKEENWKD